MQQESLQLHRAPRVEIAHQTRNDGQGHNWLNKVQDQPGCSET